MVQEFLKLCQVLTVASTCLTRDQDRECARVALAFLLFMELWLKQFVLVHSNDPVLLQFAADGTPISYRRRQTFRLGGRSVRREGDGTAEFLVQRLAVSTASLLGSKSPERFLTPLL